MFITKRSISVELKRPWLNLGWYPGEEFRVFNLKILEIVPEVELCVIFSFQFLWFVFAFGLNI